LTLPPVAAADPSLISPPIGHFLRDGRIELQLTSNTPQVDPLSSFVRVKGVQFANSQPCDAGTFCARFAIPLASIPQTAMTETFEVTGSLSGQSGTRGSGTLDGGITVTRFKWARQVCGSVNCLVASPAVTPAGSLVVVANQPDGGGELVELTLDAGTHYRRPSIAAMGAIGVGSINPPGNDWNIVLTRQTRRFGLSPTVPGFGFYDSSGAQVFVCEGSSNQGTIDVPALVERGSTSLSVIGFQTYAGNLVGLGRFGRDATQCLPVDSVEVMGVANGGMPGNVVVTSASGEGRGYYLDVTAGLTRFQRTSGDPRPRTPLVRGPTFDAGVLGLALARGAQGGNDALAFATSNELVIVNFPDTGAPGLVRIPGAQFSSPVLLNPGVAVVDLAPLARLRVFGFDGGLIEASVALSGYRTGGRPTSPIAASGGIVYVADGDTNVFALNLSDGGVDRYATGLTFTSTAAAPTLVCQRGTGTGLFISTTTSGYVTATIVDSPTLDPTAPWPKAFHDTANTGVSDTPEPPCP